MLCGAGVPVTVTPSSWKISKVCLTNPDQDNEWEIYGELTNNTGIDQGYVYVSITFLDSSNTDIGYGDGEVRLSLVPAGATMPFSGYIVSDNPPASYTLNIEPDALLETPVTDLSLSNLTFTAGDTLLQGEVCGNSEALDNAEVSATFYSRNGLFVVATGFDNPIDIPKCSDGSTPFRLIIEGLADIIDQSHYKLVAYGYPPPQ